MFEKEISSLENKRLLRSLRVIEARSGVRAAVDGRECVLFCSNDYLGMASHPDVTAAAKAAMEKTGSGSGSAPLICGHTRLHEKLAEDIASFKGADAAVLFGSGYLANTGLLPALAGEGDVVLSDSLNHASIIDGCRLSKADVKVYRHADASSLESALKACGGYRRKFIVTEGVFSMDGDVAPMPEIMQLAEKYGAKVILDDAHGTGTMGASGRGTLEHFGMRADNTVQMGTLGKALGSYGAFVAGPADVINWLVNSARSFMFSTALPASSCAAASAALEVIRKEPEKILHLRRNSAMLRASLLDAGYDVPGDGTPIVPVIVGDAGKALGMASSLMDAGYYAPAIRPPTVPEGKSRIRFTVSALHAEGDIMGLVEAAGNITRSGG